MIKNPTHEEGGLLDHLYVREDQTDEYHVSVCQKAKYYSDHDCICVTLCQDN